MRFRTYLCSVSHHNVPIMSYLCCHVLQNGMCRYLSVWWLWCFLLSILIDRSPHGRRPTEHCTAKLQEEKAFYYLHLRKTYLSKKINLPEFPFLRKLFKCLVVFSHTFEVRTSEMFAGFCKVLQVDIIMQRQLSWERPKNLIPLVLRIRNKNR